MKLTLTPQRWDMVAPFVTAGETVNHIDVLHVTTVVRLLRACRLSSQR